MDFLTTFDEQTKIWSGPAEVPFYDTNCSIGQVIFEQMKNDPTKVCQVSDIDDLKVTNATALKWSISIAKHLKKLNLQAPECVGIIGKNTNYLMAVTYGCLMNTTPFHAINPAHEEELIKHAFGITKPRLIFCDANVYENVFNATKSWQPICYTLDKTLENVQSVESLLKESAPDEHLNYYPELLTEGATQTVAILCSSGTTGLPKAVCIQNKDLFYSCRVFADDVLFSLSGIDWISGLSTLILAGTKGCLRIITNKPFTPQYFANLVHKHKITYFATPPRIIALLLANASEIGEQFRSLRLVLCGGGCFTEAMFSGMQRLISPHGQLSQLYALTEFGLVSSNYKKTKQTSPGFLRAGLRARIVDDAGVSLGPNASGELLLNIGRKWNGYFNNPKATAEVIDEGNWLHTGDIAYFDNDGYLFIVDRKKETMKNNGFHYWPTEIENIITELPEVIEACVVGVYNEQCGHIPAALVRKLSNSNLTADDIKGHVAQRCPGYKHLNAGVIFVDALPLNKNGKVLRREAKVLFEEMTKGIEAN